jgi:ubiquinone/menaquinone biosynthesis C-methylase UbiE
MSELDPTEQGRQVWDAVAPAWERYRDRLFDGVRPVSEWLVEQVDPRPGQTILELTAGPGETGFLAAERVGPSGRLISTDFAPAMVEALGRGAQARGLANVEPRVMDAQHIDLASASVDAVISRFGLMLVADPARALSEARRVLGHGGRLAYAVWGPPNRNPWLLSIVAALVQNRHLPPRDPFAPGGVFSLATPDRNRELCDGARFSGVRVEEIAGSFHYADLYDYWLMQTAVAGPIDALVKSLSGSEIDAIHGVLEPMIEPFRVDDGYDIPTLAVAVSAA